MHRRDGGGVTEDLECQDKNLDLVLDKGQLLKDFMYGRSMVRFGSCVETGLGSTLESREIRVSDHVGTAKAALMPW